MVFLYVGSTKPGIFHWVGKVEEIILNYLIKIHSVQACITKISVVPVCTKTNHFFLVWLKFERLRERGEERYSEQK